jgi:hypothetical protein
MEIRMIIALKASICFRRRTAVLLLCAAFRRNDNNDADPSADVEIAGGLEIDSSPAPS